MSRVPRLGRFRRSGIRRLSSALFRHLDDEGHWCYSPEWWGGGGADGHTVFRSTSQHGNGIVSVAVYPSSRPAKKEWPIVEGWLQERYAKIHPELNHIEKFKLLGYQWRVLRFNDDTRQSTVKTMAAYREADHTSIYLMQQPHCLAVPYLKSMVSCGLTALSSSGFDLSKPVSGIATMNVLCIGLGGGSLPLFLATKIKGAIIDVVEIDPVVVSASIEAMGFPSSAVGKLNQTSVVQHSNADSFLWSNIHNQLHLHLSDAEDFIIHTSKTYDLIFIDAYDGDDIFPQKLWDVHGPFLKSLQSRLHPEHGTVVVNLHADSDVLESGISGSNLFGTSVLPMGKYVTQVCRAYKEHLSFAFTVSVPWLCNLTLVASTGTSLGKVECLNRERVLSSLVSKSDMVEYLLDLPFSCLQYIKRGFLLVD